MAAGVAPLMSLPELGIIEGFYGIPWTWTARAANVAFLAPHGYRSYMYAPKGDPFLRLRWQEPHPDAHADELTRFSAVCRKAGMRFGVGLSPVLKDGFTTNAKAALERKLSFLDDVGVDDFALLFDDMRGETPDLAKQQIEVAHWAAAHTKATRVIVCGSYYTDDPVLDRVFGARPPGYEAELGANLDASIGIYWTGEEVCSRQFTTGHLERVTDTLRRKPTLWDNYPVNDGARMSQYLHIRGFTGRPASIAEHIAAHGVNPAVQPTLSRIPMLTLTDSYRLGDAYEYGSSFRAAALRVAGSQLAQKLYEDVLVLQDVGLDRLGEKEALLRSRYEGETHDAAKEIVAWLNGEYRITDALVRAMVGNDQG